MNQRIEPGMRTKVAGRVDGVVGPTISIITVCLNHAAQLELTVRSVAEQSCRDFEYIVIDGGSADRTPEIVREYRNDIDLFISEPDNGISDAFNKGIALSRGDYIQILNAGDVLLGPDTLSQILPALRGDIVAFKARIKDRNKTIPSVFKCAEIYDLRDRAILSHQATFVRREVYKNVGAYNENYRIRMDFEFFLRAVQSHVIRPQERVIVEYDVTGISSSLKNKLQYKAEELRAICMVAGCSPSVILLHYLRLPFYLAKVIAGRFFWGFIRLIRSFPR